MKGKWPCEVWGQEGHKSKDPGRTLLFYASRAQISRSHSTLVLFSRHDELLLIHRLLPSFYELDNKLEQKDKKKMVAIKSGGQKRLKEGHAIRARFVEAILLWRPFIRVTTN